jgi:hypothetical protein
MLPVSMSQWYLNPNSIDYVVWRHLYPPASPPQTLFHSGLYQSLCASYSFVVSALWVWKELFSFHQNEKKAAPAVFSVRYIPYVYYIERIGVAVYSCIFKCWRCHFEREVTWAGWEVTWYQAELSLADIKAASGFLRNGCLIKHWSNATFVWSCTK